MINKFTFHSESIKVLKNNEKYPTSQHITLRNDISHPAQDGYRHHKYIFAPFSLFCCLLVLHICVLFNTTAKQKWSDKMNNEILGKSSMKFVWRLICYPNILRCTVYELKHYHWILPNTHNTAVARWYLDMWGQKSFQKDKWLSSRCRRWEMVA